MTGTHRMEVDLPGRKLVWEAELDFRSDLENFYDSLRPVSDRERRLVREKTWKETIPRDHQ